MFRSSRYLSLYPSDVLRLNMESVCEEKEIDKLRKTIEEFRAKAERNGNLPPLSPTHVFTFADTKVLGSVPHSDSIYASSDSGHWSSASNYSSGMSSNRRYGKVYFGNIYYWQATRIFVCNSLQLLLSNGSDNSNSMIKKQWQMPDCLVKQGRNRRKCFCVFTQLLCYCLFLLDVFRIW